MHRASLLLFTTLLILLFLTAELPAAKSSKKETTPKLTMGEAINKAGRQRMLSQRIAKYYAYKSWGFDNPEYDEEMNKAMTQFKSALEFLKAAPENTSEIDAALAKVEKDWDTFELTKRVKKGAYIPSLVMRSMEKILTQMNYITALYAAILK